MQRHSISGCGTNAQGVRFGILRAFIDTGHWPDIVKPWIRSQNQQVVMGLFAIPHPAESMEAPPGWLHLPKPRITQEWAKQL